MAKGLKLKVLFNFALPLMIALLHAYFASLAFMSLLGATNQIPIFIVMAVYTAIYAVFALTAYNHSKEQLDIQYNINKKDFIVIIKCTMKSFKFMI